MDIVSIPRYFSLMEKEVRQRLQWVKLYEESETLVLFVGVAESLVRLCKNGGDGIRFKALMV